MRNAVSIVLALAAAMAVGSAFAEQKGQTKGDRPDKAQGITIKSGDKAAPKSGGAAPARDIATGQASGVREQGSGQATGRRQHLPAATK